MPVISSEMKRNVINIYNEKGIEFLQKEVKLKDPKYYSEVDEKNPQRLMRALEIFYSTNKTFSSFKTALLNWSNIRKVPSIGYRAMKWIIASIF